MLAQKIRKKNPNNLHVESSLTRVTRVASRLQFGTLTEYDVNGHVGNACIDFPTLPIS